MEESFCGLPLEKIEWMHFFQNTFETLDKALVIVSAHCNKIQTISIQLYDFLDKFLKSEEPKTLTQQQVIKCFEFSKACTALAGFCVSLSDEKWLKFFIKTSVHFTYDSLSKMWDAWKSCSEEFDFTSFEYKESLLYAHCQDLLSIHKQLAPKINEIPPIFQKNVIQKLNLIEKNLSALPPNNSIGKNDKILKHTEWLTIKENIGVGGYAVVHLAKMKSTGQLVAVKELKAVQLGVKSVLYMKREIDALIRLNHPNVVHLIGVTVTPPFSFVTNYVPNGCLIDLLHGKESSPRATPLFRSKVALDTARAMEYVHKLGLVHRDFKPPNILLDENDRSVVCDFGLARIAGRRMSAELGTMQWCAPELLTAGVPYNQNIDVYAYGITLWELMTSESPYKGYRQIQFCNLVLKYGERPPIPDGQPPELVKLIKRCWHQDKTQRPTFKEIRELLETGNYCFMGTDPNEFKEFVESTKKEHTKYMLEAEKKKTIPQKQLENLKRLGPYDSGAKAALESVINGELLSDDIIEILVTMCSIRENSKISKKAINIIANDKTSNAERIGKAISSLFNTDPEYVIEIAGIIAPRITDKVAFLKNFFKEKGEQAPQIADIILAMHSVSVLPFAFDSLDEKYILPLFKYFYEAFGPCDEVIHASFTTFNSFKYLLMKLKEQNKLNILAEKTNSPEEDIIKCILIICKESWRHKESDLTKVIKCFGNLIKESGPGQASLDFLDACSHFEGTSKILVSEGYIDTLASCILSHRESVVVEAISIIRVLQIKGYTQISEEQKQKVFNNSAQCFNDTFNEKVFNFIINLFSITKNCSYNISLFIESLFSRAANPHKALDLLKAAIRIPFAKHRITIGENIGTSLDRVLTVCDQNAALAIGFIMNECVHDCNNENSLYMPLIAPSLKYLYKRKPCFEVAHQFLKLILESFLASQESDEFQDVGALLVNNDFITYLNTVPLLYPNQSSLTEIITTFADLFSSIV